MYVGKKVTRVDAYDKVIGRTRYTDDLCDKSAYIARIFTLYNCQRTYSFY